MHVRRSGSLVLSAVANEQGGTKGEIKASGASQERGHIGKSPGSHSVLLYVLALNVQRHILKIIHINSSDFE